MVGARASSGGQDGVVGEPEGEEDGGAEVRVEDDLVAGVRDGAGAHGVAGGVGRIGGGLEGGWFEGGWLAGGRGDGGSVRGLAGAGAALGVGLRARGLRTTGEQEAEGGDAVAAWHGERLPRAPMADIGRGSDGPRSGRVAGPHERSPALSVSSAIFSRSRWSGARTSVRTTSNGKDEARSPGGGGEGVGPSLPAGRAARR